MTATAQQIVTLFEEVGLTPEQIAEDQEMDISVVKLALTQHSPQYRSALRENEETFSDDEYNAAKMAISGLVFAEDESVRLRAATFVVNEKKGRNNILCNKNGRQLGNNTNFNILVVNQQLARAREALDKSKGNTSKVIDVETKISDESKVA